jgi:type II secretory pathway component PulJ
VELMVTITIGLFIVLGMSTMLANNLRSSSQLAASNRLQQEMRSSMALMVRDIRRAGYWGNATSGIAVTAAAYNNPFDLITVTSFNSPPADADNCILYRYDLNADGTLASNERFGFRLNPDTKTIQARTSGGSAEACDTNSDQWESLSDPGTTEFTKLIFQLTPSAPFYITPPTGPNIVSRTVTIELTAQLKTDASVKQTLIETVKLENDVFRQN